MLCLNLSLGYAAKTNLKTWLYLPCSSVDIMYMEEKERKKL